MKRQNGKWIPVQGIEAHKCSCCGSKLKVETCLGDPIWSYCPYCGAKMKETGEKNEGGQLMPLFAMFIHNLFSLYVTTI